MTWCGVKSVAAELRTSHYLGPAKRGFAWESEEGIMVFSSPTSRRLPKTWVELTRWCLRGEPNAGSSQWARVRKLLLERGYTTVVSYSDPSAGHTGSLYRACGWLWAPTWHVLRPPPSGNGSWVTGKVESVKMRWIDPLCPESGRCSFIRVNDKSLKRKFPWAEYSEPRWKKRRGAMRRTGGGGDYSRWVKT